MSLKKIDKLLLRTFITTFILLLILVLFIMVIQTFFTIFSNIAGKGLGIKVYSKLFFYLSLNIIPDAFPIAILMTSLIVFGNFSENFELTAMRSVGLSLQNTICLPLIFIFFLSSTLFYFQNYIYPNSKQKIFCLVNDIWKKKSTLLIQQGIFCNNIPGYSIRVNKKSINNELMEGIIIYDYTKKYAKVCITIAEKGKFYITSDENYLIIELNNGSNYIEFLPKKNDRFDHKLSFYRNSFLNQKIKIALEALKLSKTHIEYTVDPRTKTRPYLKKLIKEKKIELLDHCINIKKFLLQDSISYYTMQQSTQQLNDNNQIDEFELTFQTKNLYDNFILFRDQLIKKNHLNDIQFKKLPCDYTLKHIVQNALYNIKQRKKKIIDQINNKKIVHTDLNDALYEQEYRCAVAIRCIIVFLLSVPLGCIIRQGGFGISIIISSFFILLEYIISIIGRNCIMSNTISTFWGAWLSNFMLLPFCFFFLLKEKQGQELWSIDWYNFFIKKIIKSN